MEELFLDLLNKYEESQLDVINEYGNLEQIKNLNKEIQDYKEEFYKLFNTQ